MYPNRLPPQDQEAEDAVIGSLLIDGQTLPRIAVFIKADDFSSDRNRAAFQSCVALFERSEPINQITLTHELQRRGVLETMGGPGFIAALLVKVPTSAHIEHYARIVQRTSMMRRLIRAAELIADVGYENNPDVDTAISRAEDFIFKLRLGDGSRDFVHIRDVLDTYLEEKKLTTRTRPDAPTQIPTNYIDLDRLLGGLQRSDLIILAARPSIGKSSLALNMAYNASKKSGAHVGIFSLEMGKEQLVDRLISSISRIESTRLRQFRQGDHPEADETALHQAIGELAELPIWIDDTPLLTVVEMRSKARRLHMEAGLDFLIVDYLQLMQGEPTQSFSTNRTQELSVITRSLKGLARDLDVPVLALSQLRRAVEQRPGQRPTLFDLRESGSIEQDSDVVMFIHREDKIIAEEEWDKLHPDMPYPKGIAELIVEKHRHGPTGKVQLFFDEKTTTFKNAFVRVR